MKKCRKLGSAHGWLACSLCLLLVISSLVQPLISSASERRLIPRFSSTQHPNAEGKKVTPLPPERGTPTGLNLPNLDEVRYRQRQELKAPPPIESTKRSRRKAEKPRQKQKSHHAISRRLLTANLSSTTKPVEPQSNPPSFTDDPLKDPNNPDSFKIKALHITELRYGINLLRNRRGLGDYPWVKPAASGGAINSSVLISWEPIDEMRTALNQALGAPANGYAPGLGLNQLILAAHIQELRDRVKSEWETPLADQLVPARIDLFNQSGNQIEARDCEWGIPLVSLPGRAGLELGISLTYSSMVWSTAGSSISFDDDRGDPSPGFKIGFPTIQGRYTDTAVGTNVYLLITSAGRRVELRRVGSSNVYEAGDSSYLQLIDYGNSLLLHTTDGTQMSYARTGSDWHCTAIEDRNGNLISATYNGDDLATVTDTLSRVFYFNYDANGNLTSISQNWSGWWRDLATFGWGTKTLHPAFSGYTVVGAYDGEVIPVLTQVGLMDGSHYNFEYTDRGQVNVIRHYAADGAPGTAGDLQLSYLAYDYESPAGDCPRISAARLWATNWNIVNGAPAEVPTSFADNHDGTHQMETPDHTVYKEFYGSGWQHGLVTSSQVIIGSSVQKTTTTSWTQDNEGVAYQTNPRVYQTLVSDGTNNRKTTIGYQTITLPVSNVSCSLPNEVNEFAADQTTVLRRTHTDYNLDTSYIDPNYLNLNRRIIGLPSARLIYEGASTLKSKTTYVYDQGGEYLQNTSASTIQHDDSHYPIGVVGRGNLTKAIRWDVNDPNQTANTADKIAYDITGNVIFTRDALDHQTSISYADKFSADGVSLDAPRSFATFAYPTSVTDADGFSSSVWYNYDFAARTRTQGPPPQNQSQGIIQTFSYEAMRLKQVTTVNTGAYTHYDYGPDYTSSFSSVNSVAANYWQSDLYTNRFFDGLGRVFAVASNHPGSSGGNKGQYTRYDQMGRAMQQTNPFEMDSGWNPTGDDQSGYQFNVANTFDWKGRPLKSYNMDGTYKEASYAGCGCAGGEVVTLTDEVGRQQKVYSDVLGRTVKTELLNWEGGSVYATTVNTKNALDRVTLVRQYQGDESSATYQDTTATYDGYGRLKTKHVPQQQVDPNNSASTDHTTWTYNEDDTTASITDARGATQNFSYSNNNRQLLSGITYGAPSGIPVPASVSFIYDAAGNRKKMTDGFGTVDYTYDQLSALTEEKRTFSDPDNSSINGIVKIIGYDYNLAGELKSITDPSQSTVSYTYDNAGRLTNVGGSNYGSFSQFASNLQYRAWGGLTHLDYGNNVHLTQQYDGRLRLTRYALSSPNYGEIWVNRAENYQYYDDNRIKFMADEVDNRFDRAYGYDQAGRLAQALTGVEAHGQENWSTPYRETFNYDSWGNTTGRYTRHWSFVQQYSGISFTNNRSQPYYGYDADGRVLVSYIGVTAPNRIYYKYDALGQKVEARLGNNSNILNHGFDGDGQWIKVINTKVENSVTTTTNGYEVRSSLLGGQVIQDIDALGTKLGQHVYTSGGSELATGNAETTMIFKQIDPVTATEQLTWTDGRNNGRTELDPLGGDVGLQPPDVEEPDTDLPMRFGRLSEPANKCSIDFLPSDCNSMMLSLQGGGATLQYYSSWMNAPVGSTATMRFRNRDTGEVRSRLALLRSLPDGGRGYVPIGAKFDEGNWFSLSLGEGALGMGSVHRIAEGASVMLNPQNSGFLIGRFGFNAHETERLGRAYDKITSDRCRKFFDDTLAAMGKKGEIKSGYDFTPTTLASVLAITTLNRYSPNLTASQLGISQKRVDYIRGIFETENVGGVTLARDGRVFLGDMAFYQAGPIAQFLVQDGDLPGNIVHEFFHRAGLNEEQVKALNPAIQLNCGNPKDAL